MDRETATELVRGLVEIPSLSRQESVASAWLTAQMRGAGFDRAYVDDAGNAVGELGDPQAPRTIVLLADLPGMPATTHVVPEFVPLRGEGLAYAERLRAAGVDVEVHRVPGALHGFWWMAGVLGQAGELTDWLGVRLRSLLG
jgi:acetyl esterase/lipase